MQLLASLGGFWEFFRGLEGCWGLRRVFGGFLRVFEGLEGCGGDLEEFGGF